MGTISKGILGGFSGKVGKVVGGSWKGIDYMRSMAGKRTGQPTASQVDQQEKFALIMRFLQPFSPLLMFSFKSYANRKTGINAAMSYNLQNAIMGTESPFSIDISKVLLCRGDLPAAGNITTTPVTGNKIKFTWTNNSGTGIARASDKCIPIALNRSLNATVYIAGATSRESTEAELDCASITGEPVETWLAFMSEDGKRVSNSVYTGICNLLP